MPKPFIVFPGQAPRLLNVAGEQITVLACAEQTHGYEIFLQQGPAGSGVCAGTCTKVPAGARDLSAPMPNSISPFTT